MGPFSLVSPEQLGREPATRPAGPRSACASPDPHGGGGDTSRAARTPAEAAGSGGPAFRGTVLLSGTDLAAFRAVRRSSTGRMQSGSGHRPSHGGCPAPQRERRGLQRSDIRVTEPPSGRGEGPPGPEPPGLSSVPFTRSCASASVRPSRACERGWRRSEMAAARPRTASPQAFLWGRPPVTTQPGVPAGVSPPGRAVPGLSRRLSPLPARPAPAAVPGQALISIRAFKSISRHRCLIFGARQVFPRTITTVRDRLCQQWF